MGSSLFWYENWTGLGSLYFLMSPDFAIDESINNVYDVVDRGTWDVDKHLESLPEEYAAHILENVKAPVSKEVLDKLYWSLETKRNFSVKTKWEYLTKEERTWTSIQEDVALKVTKVIWEFPNEGWIKVNTDGASRGNPGRSSIGYVLRDEEGDVIYALGREIPPVTNNEAEALAILEALRYCVNH
nr:uncharacterized protein LOC117277459 [Nicotiana tomentosiformis]